VRLKAQKCQPKAEVGKSTIAQRYAVLVTPSAPQYQRETREKRRRMLASIATMTAVARTAMLRTTSLAAPG
jgi:hypothetical protein